MKTETETWKTYRTRFLVKARKLSSNLTFVDSLGRQHSGRKGDYLVESSEGLISIAPRQIFEDIYVAIGIEEGRLGEGAHPIPRGDPDDSVHGGRKMPQSYRARALPGTRLGMM
jgi:hypothetical protein